MGDDQDRIVYCRDIDPDTVLHMSMLGDRYVMRRFDGSDPFTPEKGGESELRVCYVFPLDRELDEEEARHPVSDEAWWSEHVRELNGRLLANLRDAGKP